MTEVVKIVAGADIHSMDKPYMYGTRKMRIFKKTVRHDYTTYWLEPYEDDISKAAKMWRRFTHLFKRS